MKTPAAGEAFALASIDAKRPVAKMQSILCLKYYGAAVA
jgi:hypothetical protein